MGRAVTITEGMNASPSLPIARSAPRPGPSRWRGLATGLALAGVLASGAVACASDEPVVAGPYRLVFFDSCADALADLRAAAKEVVGPYGLPGAWDALVDIPPVLVTEERAAADGRFTADAPAAIPESAGGPAAGPAADHSRTTVHEAGVDEPDLVKTDGRRIVTVSNGRLSVVDVASRRLVGVVDLLASDVGYDATLLLAGDHALVLSTQVTYPIVVEDWATPPRGIAEPVPDGPVNPPVDGPMGERPVVGASILLVDLTTPRILSRARADGSIVDARQVGSTVRIVTRSAPRLDFRATTGTEAERIAANQAVIDASDIDAWAPRLEVTTGDETVRTRVPCESISRPSRYSGATLLTVLTFDISRDALDDGHPVTIVADGDTVYSNGTSLYVASNQAWTRLVPALAARTPAEARTEIYRFDTTTTPPRFVGGGSVPGHLINQYAMSEWDGRLRVATTVDDGVGPDGVPQSHSGVYVLETKGDRLVQVGKVDGLGKGERIYAVRFVGPVGYVVTFRQTDPLYTVDLRDPTAPVVRGELKIPGYSAYLHPIDDTRLLGIGQDATDTGQTRGTQVALFDVSDLAAPTRVAHYTLPGRFSEAEVDPHAFLYWPADNLVVVPLQSWFVGPSDPVPFRDAPDRAFAPRMTTGALVLRISDDRIVEVGFISHPPMGEFGYQPPVRRSLITTAGRGTTLWTVSEGGLLATDPTTLTRLAWIPF